MVDGKLDSSDRETALTFRMSFADRTQLKQDAAAAGLTLQQLYEQRMLGAVKPRAPMGRPRKHPQNEELPLVKSA